MRAPLDGLRPDEAAGLMVIGCAVVLVLLLGFLVGWWLGSVL